MVLIYYTDHEVSGTHIDLRNCDGPRVGDDGGEAALEFLVHQLKNAHKKHSVKNNKNNTILTLACCHL